MPTFDRLQDVDWTILLAIILPGFVSIHVHRLIRPAEQLPLKDLLVEALFFGLINATVAGWPLLKFAGLGSVSTYVAGLLGLIVLPAAWPFLFNVVVGRLAALRIVLNRAHTSWDHFFLQRQPCWVVVVMKNGALIGGYFGSRSHASLYPRPGHLYLEEVWTVGEDGSLVSPVPGSRGVVLRPDDYSHVLLRGHSDEQ